MLHHNIRYTVNKYELTNHNINNFNLMVDFGLKNLNLYLDLSIDFKSKILKGLFGFITKLNLKVNVRSKHGI